MKKSPQKIVRRTRGRDTGNALSNYLTGGRGNDVVNSGTGNDMLDGGKGNDTLTGGADNDFFVIHKEGGATTTITDFTPGGMEKVLLVGFDNIADFTQLSVAQEGANTRVNLGTGQSVLLQNVATTQISEQSFGFFSDDAMLNNFRAYMSGGAVATLTSAVDNMLLPNNMGNLGIFALGGNDVLGSQTSNDFIDGGDGNDTVWGDYPGYAPVPGKDWLEGGAGSDWLYGGGADDLLRGGSGDDVLYGDAGNDVLYGATGNDYLDGGAGDDLIFLEGDVGTVDGSNFLFYGTRVGGAGADVFKVTANGGGNSGFSASGTQFSAYNLIADFDTTQTGELIDLTALKWVRGFGDLSIQNMIINGTQVARITAGDGYRITKLDDATYRVVDTRAGRDGADILKNIENKPARQAQFRRRLTSRSEVKQRSCVRSHKLNFADVSARNDSVWRIVA